MPEPITIIFIAINPYIHWLESILNTQKEEIMNSRIFNPVDVKKDE